jgi:hypothetical protein
LAIALETARKLASRGATALIDLGATQDWLADVLDREETADAKVAGLTDLLAGRATFGDVIRRALSSNLDIISAGGDLTGVEGLDEIFAALASAYGRVVTHASDWRTAAAQAAAARADAIVIVSPPARLEGAVQSAQRANLIRRFSPFAPGSRRRTSRTPLEAAARVHEARRKGRKPGRTLDGRIHAPLEAVGESGEPAERLAAMNVSNRASVASQRRAVLAVESRPAGRRGVTLRALRGSP